MLYYLFDFLDKQNFPGAGLFDFFSFRAGLAMITSLIISILFGLECFVALIQSYVFFILLSLFLKDIINLSH